MQKDWIKFSAILAIIAGALVVITPLAFAPPCQELLELKAGGLISMKCFWTARIFILIGLLIVVTGILQAFAKGRESRQLLSILLIAQAVALLLVPKSIVIGICGMDMAACHLLVKFETIFVVIILLTGLFSLWASRKTVLDNKENLTL